MKQEEHMKQQQKEQKYRPELRINTDLKPLSKDDPLAKEVFEKIIDKKSNTPTILKSMTFFTGKEDLANFQQILKEQKLQEQQMQMLLGEQLVQNLQKVQIATQEPIVLKEEKKLDKELEGGLQQEQQDIEKLNLLNEQQKQIKVEFQQDLVQKQEKSVEKSLIQQKQQQVIELLKKDVQIEQDLGQKQSNDYDQTQLAQEKKQFLLGQEQLPQIQEKSLLSDFLYLVEWYQYKGDNVVHLKINSEVVSIEKIQKEGLQVVYSKQKGTTVKSSQYMPDQAKAVKRHSIEEGLLSNAIVYLLESNAKTVLIDIFERESGIIKVSANNVLQVHTVVLYKNPSVQNKHEILVIDPSNFLFSSHLATFKLGHGAFDKITTIHKTLQIYKPSAGAEEQGLIGPNSDQWRYCDDIAVKLAFGLNGVEQLVLSVENIKNLSVIKAISNNDAVNDSLLPDIVTAHFSKYPLRIQQKSSLKNSQYFYELSKKFKNYLDVKNIELLIENYINVILKLKQEEIYEQDALRKICAICESACYQKIGSLEEQKFNEMKELESLGKLSNNLQIEDLYE